MGTQAKARYVTEPDFGFSRCLGEIQANALSLTNAFRIMAVSTPIEGCEEGPFADRFGLFVEEPEGWLLVFSGPYLGTFTPVDRGGSGRQAVLLPLDSAPRYQIVVEGMSLMLRSGDNALELYTKTP